MKKILYIISICALLMSCTNASEDDLIDSTPPPDLVTYEGDVKSIIDNNCISCHSDPPENGATISLVTFEQVEHAVENHNLIGRITGSSGPLMPQGGPKLPQNLIDIIIQWEADGLLEHDH